MLSGLEMATVIVAGVSLMVLGTTLHGGPVAWWLYGTGALMVSVAVARILVP